MNISDFRGELKQHHCAMTKLSYVILLFSYHFDNYCSVTSPMLEVQCIHVFLTNAVNIVQDFFNVSYLMLSVITNGRESRLAGKESGDI